MFGLVWLNIGQMTLTGNNIRPNLDFLSTDGTPVVVEVQGVPLNRWNSWCSRSTGCSTKHDSW